ncbi:uncharacterized protein TEX48 [Carlito syrichta]|uniref:Uncharacterized protein TEX48 n=1 Tax=Carlito syrichta TaxID=1868482 RepID=A0A3Q0DWJ8_CARSF|nr:uncharacterized protein TEX48 [Carlito syrichta]
MDCMIYYVNQAAHRKLTSKIFCLCCRDCQEINSSDNSTVISQTQEYQTSTHSLQLQKDELNRQNPKHANAASHLPSEQPLIHPEKNTSSSSSEFEDPNTKASQRNFYKRNINRYSQERGPFQSCFIGRS